MKVPAFLAFPAAAFFLAAFCTDPRLAGPTTEQGNPQIVAIVVDDIHRPVTGATVIMYRVSTLSDSTQQPSSAINIAVRQTDSLGKCSFEDISPGSYSLEATDSANSRSALTTNIAISTIKPVKPEYSDTIILVTPGGINGIVSRGGVAGIITNQNLNDAFIQVKIGEIDRSTVTGPDGKYSFANLPAGSYTLFYYATDGFYSAKRENILVHPGVDTTLDTVILRAVPRLSPPKNLSARYDTVAGIIRLNWQKVVFDSLRWYEVERINITAPGDTVYISYDTLFSDTVARMPKGTILDYVVRSVDRAFNRSPNAGPVEITVKN
jgi:uncharacterized protein (DUF2141 family)